MPDNIKIDAFKLYIPKTLNSKNNTKKLMFPKENLKQDVFVRVSEVKPDKSKPIKDDEEYILTMYKLMRDPKYYSRWNIEGADIFDLGIQPYAGDFDMHDAINGYIKNKDIGEFWNKIFNSISSDISTEDYIIDIIRCLKYALKKEDEKFGQYQGIVYRTGFFGEKEKDKIKTQGCESTSYAPECLSMHINRDKNVILVNNGHKIYKTQERLEEQCKKSGKNPSQYSSGEKEILLNPNEKYRRITPTPELAESVNYALDNSPLISNNVANKIKNKLIFWEKID